MNKNSPFINIFFAVLFLCSLSACGVKQSSSSRSGSKLYKTFYIGEEGLQYFIKPLVLQSAESHDLLSIDFTFVNKEPGNVIVNFSMITKEVKNEANMLRLIATKSSVDLDKLKIIFKEAGVKNFIYRYTCQMSLTELKALFGQQEFSAEIIDIDDQRYLFSSTKKTSKRIKRLNQDLFLRSMSF